MKNQHVKYTTIRPKKHIRKRSPHHFPQLSLSRLYKPTQRWVYYRIGILKQECFRKEGKAVSEVNHPEAHVNEEPRNDFMDVGVGFGVTFVIMLVISVAAAVISFMMG